MLSFHMFHGPYQASAPRIWWRSPVPSLVVGWFEIWKPESLKVMRPCILVTWPSKVRMNRWITQVPQHLHLCSFVFLLFLLTSHNFTRSVTLPVAPRLPKTGQGLTGSETNQQTQSSCQSSPNLRLDQGRPSSDPVTQLEIWGDRLD